MAQGSSQCDEPFLEKTGLLPMRVQWRRSENFKLLAFFDDCTDWFVSDLVGNQEFQFSPRRSSYFISCLCRMDTSLKHFVFMLSILFCYDSRSEVVRSLQIASPCVVSITITDQLFHGH